MLGDHVYACVWQAVRESDTFWENLPPLVSPEVFARINAFSEAHEVYFITSRPGRAPKPQTEAWLTRHGIVTPNVLCYDRKGKLVSTLGIQVVLEDSLAQATSIMETCGRRAEVFLLDRPYNRTPANPAEAIALHFLERVTSVDTFLDEVERLAAVHQE